MPTSDDKSVVSARLVKKLVEQVDKLCLKQNRNRSQMLERIVMNWYFPEYKKKHSDFTVDFSKYFNPDVKKDVISIRIGSDCVKQLDAECTASNRNRSQMLECIITQYLVEQKII